MTEEVVKAVRALCRDWGRWKRTGQRPFATRNILARIIDEGPGASSPTKPCDYVPLRDAPEKFENIERVWKTEMTRPEATAFWLHFATKKGYQKSADQIGVSVATFYRLRDKAVERLL